MYMPNQIVEYNGLYGRVMYHDPTTHTVHVLFRIESNTWKVEKCDQYFCKPAQVYLWTVESAFCVKYTRKTRTPVLTCMDIVHDYIMEI